MKTVTDKLTDSTPVTIAKAASILSKFLSSETGASQAVNAYLLRATAAFDGLARLHSKSDRRKHKKDSAPTQSLELIQSELLNNNQKRLKKEAKEESNVGEETEGKKKKGDLAEETERSNEVKKEKVEVEFEENRGEVVDKVEIKEEYEKKQKKKRKSEEVEVEVEVEAKEEDEGQRKKKKRRKQADDN